MKTPMRLLALVACLLGIFCSSQASAACFLNCTYTQTKYPIVLAHGAIGFQKMFGVDYWYATVEGLQDGGAKVFTPKVDPLNSSQVRGEQLLKQVKDILALTGATKVNIIGHAQGGLDARYVAAVAPNLVASVTTIGTPHTGSAPFDLMAKVIGNPNSLPQPLIDFANLALKSVYKLMTGIEGQTIDVRAATQTLSYAGAKTFNTAYPAGIPTTACGQGAATVNGIKLYSWTGTALKTNALDLTDDLFAPLALLTPGAETEGFTERCSSHFGTVIYDRYLLNHLDAVNNLLGLRSALGPDPVTLVRAHANRLKGAGL